MILHLFKNKFRITEGWYTWLSIKSSINGTVLSTARGRLSVDGKGRQLNTRPSLKKGGENDTQNKKNSLCHRSFSKFYLCPLNVFEKLSAANPTVLGTYLDASRCKKIFDDYTAETEDLIKQRLQIIYDEELHDHPEYANKTISIEVAEGFPAELILSKAKELDCDAIIMGTHGKGILANTFLGSTAKRVLRRTRKPVLIIPLPKEETEATS